MSRRLLLATRNQGKLAELRRLLQTAVPGVEVIGLSDVDEYPEAPETGATFADNALLKAREAARYTGLPAVADDSGLTVDALNGMPGVLVDGNDVVAVRDTVAEAVERARSGRGPTVIEALTYRHFGHSRTDPATYRPKQEVEEWLARDPLLVARRRLVDSGVAEAEAMRAMSEADLRAMVRMIEGEAAVALSRYEAARDRQSALTADVVPRARLAIEPAVAGYAAGRVPLVTVVEAVQALWQVEAELVDAEMNAALARVRLGRAMGILEGVSR